MPTVLDWLLTQYPNAKRQTFKRMVQARRILINGQPARAVNQPIKMADRVKVITAQPEKDRRSVLQIIHEDDDILVVNKPPGLLTSTVPGEKRPTLLAMVKDYLAQREPTARVGLIHRLDRDASGLLIFSKNDTAYRSLKMQFFKHAVDRIYLAIVAGAPNPRSGRIESRLVERADGTVHSTKQLHRGQRAVTEYEVLDTTGKKSFLRVRLHTGRKHQIRVHLSEKAVPVLGDKVYGGSDSAAKLMLVAAELSIRHPRTGQRIDFKIHPADFKL